MDKRTKDFIAWLKRARERVRSGWTQNAFARDRAGYIVSARSVVASCWCQLGAIKATDPHGNRPSQVANAQEIEHWNDAPGRTQSEVIAMFDNSIRALGGRP